jgi:hypothetical protein
MSYSAVVGRIYTSPHPNADRLKIGHICGAVVVVGLDTQDGELYAFFESDGQLTEGFARANNLNRDSSKNADTTKTGFFEENRRVRAQPFRGVRSEGFAVPLSYFSYTGYDISQLKEGDQFNELNKVVICQKYYTPATLKAMRNGTGPVSSNPYITAFPQHYDTTQFRYAHLEKGDLVIITEKEHGTSVRYGHVEVEYPKNWFWKTMRFLRLEHYLNGVILYTDGKPPKTIKKEEYVLGTRRAILKKKTLPKISIWKGGISVKNKISETEYTGGYYGNGEPYTIVPRKLFGKLKLGEIVYGEIVGYCENGKPLFTHGLDKLPELEKQYGSPITYSYGCIQGQSRFRLYRITVNGRDLSWFEVLQRSKQIDCEVVSEIDRFVYDGNRERLNAYVATLLEGSSLIDETHMREGVCIRIENEHGHKVFKEKSYSFKVAEGIAKDSNDYVDSEEIA